MQRLMEAFALMSPKLDVVGEGEGWEEKEEEEVKGTMEGAHFEGIESALRGSWWDLEE